MVLLHAYQYDLRLVRKFWRDTVGLDLKSSDNFLESHQDIQINRSKKLNAKLTNKELEKYCQLESDGQLLLDQAVQKFQLSARAYHRILKVALTIANIEGSEKIEKIHLSEALNYHSRKHSLTTR